MQRLKYWGALAIALVCGLLILWVDSRPGWDDTGISVGMLLLVTTILGFLLPKRAWLWALAVGIWIPLAAILVHQNYAAILALIIAFFGAYAGALAHKVLSSVFR